MRLRAGSFVNQVMEQSRQAVPVVGMGATELCFTDRHAYTIVEVMTPRYIVVQQDTATRLDKNGMSEAQDYTFTPDPNGKRVAITLRKHNGWVERGGRARFAIGERSEYHDYSF